MSELWENPAILGELAEVLDLLEDRADHLAPPLAETTGWGHPVPLTVHSRYSRDDVLAAFGLLSGSRPHAIREGVKFDSISGTDLFFVTLEKSEQHYSPSTLYRDYAISPSLFHWESQSQLTQRARTAQRYIHHRENGTHVLMFVRQHRRLGGRAQPYFCLGPAEYVRHSGERPIAFVWRLLRPMPADLFRETKVATA
ncbi:MAG: DUF3427 domain-containing protein [Vicinamibacteria bacterium]